MSFLLFFLTNPIGRLIGVGTIMLVVGFGQGYAVKARFDRSATLSATIAKQRIDLDAAKQKEADDADTLATLTKANDENQERIRALNRNPGRCIADDAAAKRMRNIR